MKAKNLNALIYLMLFSLSGLFGQTNAKHIIGRTEYVEGKVYKTTGKQYVKRSSVEKLAFLKTLGLKRIPNGYQIDHILPLSQGGEDGIDNMQLLTVVQHKIKTAIERGEVADINNSKISFSSFDNNTQKPVGIKTKSEWEIQKVISAFDIDKELSSRKVLFSGSKGGIFYYNTNGKKTYVKTKLSDIENTTVLSTQKKTKAKKIKQSEETESEYTTSSIFSTNYSTTNSSNSRTKSVKGTERIIETGARGGKYYINSNGNKTYIKKN